MREPAAIDRTPYPVDAVDAADPTFPQELRIEILTRLSALFRTAQTYDPANRVFTRQIEEYVALIGPNLEQGEDITVGLLSDYFYVNGVRVTPDSRLSSIFQRLGTDLNQRGIGGLRFLPGLHAEEFGRFFRVLTTASESDTLQDISSTLDVECIQSIALLPTLGFAEGVEIESLNHDSQGQCEQELSKKIYQEAIAGTTRILSASLKNRYPDLRQARRLVQRIVSSILRHEYSILGLTAIKEHDEYTFVHCVNVSILSMTMGSMLGLKRRAFADLGVAALLHDMGKIVIPGDVLRKPAKLDEAEWQLLRRHPLEGAKMVMRMPGISRLMLDTMRACFEHHRNFDGSGYPDAAPECRQSAVSRIVAVADCYDALTAHRAYRKHPWQPCDALTYIRQLGGSEFDPGAVWALTAAVGLYPPGTVLLTQSGFVVLAAAPNRLDPSRPHCRVLVRPDGSEGKGDERWSPMPADQHVSRVLDPEEHPGGIGQLWAA